MKDVKAIIVEDSRLARNELKRLIKAYPEIELIGEAENADQALEIMKSERPDLMFLDIHLPGRDGFELLESVDWVPSVIFTTAYDEYAVKSFEYNALDYLLKPISASRFQKAIEKALENINDSESIQKSEMLEAHSKLFIKDGERCWMVKVGEVSLFEVEGNYTKVYWGAQCPMIYKSLHQIEERLDDAMFFRVNRQQLVNLEHIDKVDPYFKGSFKIKLKNGSIVKVSRRQAVILKEKFGI
ncbi:LytR/AlgR family response regulator transcription factor [Nonlabens xiamenensis]|uniref:LytR/AlgR family response regulator transcription factor n=1 Tax=Nonlabens xiamenensis TaxID=2341043 RepID=UPI000F6075C0|nr:LytTR family DNA-binding domain-containing protein [Nonlabens xiamenensis]